MRTSVLWAVLALLWAGCGRSGPKPLALEEIPAVLRKEFQPAKLLVKQSAESVAKLVEQKSYPGAAIQLQSLIAQELSEPQREAVSAALQTVNQKLQEQAAVLEPAAAGEAAAPPVPAAKAEEAAAAAAVMERYKQTK